MAKINPFAILKEFLAKDETLKNILKTLSNPFKFGTISVYIHFIFIYARQFIQDTDFLQKQNKPIFPFVEGCLNHLSAFLKSNCNSQDFGPDLDDTIISHYFNPPDFYPVFRLAFEAAFNKFNAHIPSHPTRSLFLAAQIFDPKYILLGPLERKNLRQYSAIRELANPSDELLFQPRTLSEHNKELDASLQDQNARKCVKDLLTRRKYSKEKKEALLPDKRKEKLTIGKRVEYCAKADELEDELDDLDECVDRGAVVDIIIHEIVPSLIGKKGLRGAVHRGRSSYSSESSEGSDSVKTIVIRENEAIPHKQQIRARPRKINRSKERVVPELQQEVYIISLKLTLDRLA
ncbi:hypothetical protein RhiirA1_473230 [Rhizophagus irregularis]|uniref:Uncharacterized protein n=1 Tax=Rhizophagus irregularis TaxID=588596 RepID=A0A2N0R0Y1_9GLOM|nr:hypothetical protein RhiirA1_473230 [Rhizophagus irregularis]